MVIVTNQLRRTPSGMAAPAFPRCGRQDRMEVKPDPFPSQDSELMGKTMVTEESAQCVSLCESQPASPRESLREIVTEGKDIVQIAG